jgi:hypothetical protein
MGQLAHIAGSECVDSLDAERSGELSVRRLLVVAAVALTSTGRGKHPLFTIGAGMSADIVSYEWSVGCFMG